MARINLLPWRAERRKQRQQEFMGLLGLSALAAVENVIVTVSAPAGIEVNTRRIFQEAGFPGYEGMANAPAELETLSAGLIEL